MALKAFTMTSDYDTAISAYFRTQYAAGTQTMPLRVAALYEGNTAAASAAAFASASLLAALALLTLGFKTFLEWKTHREYERAQLAETKLNLEP